MKLCMHLLLRLGCAACLLAAVLRCAAATNAAPASAAAELRDPFSSPFAAATPVATTNARTAAPAATIAPSAQAQAAELRQALHAQGYVQQGGRCYALINGQLVTTGDVVQVRLGATLHRFRVGTVTATTINFEPLP